jgi:hypothetical protein
MCTKDEGRPALAAANARLGSDRDTEALEQILVTQMTDRWRRDGARRSF